MVNMAYQQLGPPYSVNMSHLLSVATKNGDYLNMLEWVHYGIHKGYLKLNEIPAPPLPTQPSPPISIAPKDVLALVEENAKRHHEKAISLSNDLSIKEVIVAPQPEEHVSVEAYAVAARVLNPITYYHTNWLSTKSTHLNHFFTRALAVVEQTDYSRKVFLGGIPYRMKNDELVAAFAAYNARTALLPSIDVRGHKQPGSRDFGYAYLVLASTEDLKRLLTDILKDLLKEAQRKLNATSDHEFSAKYIEQSLPPFMKRITSKHKVPVKDSEVIPWKVRDSTYPAGNLALITGAEIVEERSIFMGSLHGTATAPQLAKLLADNFGPIESVVIDTDEFRYPNGSGRATFVRRLDYEKAIKTQYLNISSLTGSVKRKTLQIDPFVMATQCALCQDKISTAYCKNCDHKLCDLCIQVNHSSEEAYNRHTFIRVRPSKSRRSSMSSSSLCR